MKAGWYADPTGAPMLRWWDGYRWTDATAPTPAAPEKLTTRERLLGRGVKPLSRYTKVLLAVVGVAIVGLLVVGLFIPHDDKDGPGYRVVRDDGLGLAYGYRDGSGWACLHNASSFACAGGTGHAKSVSSSDRGSYDVAAQIDSKAGDELVIVYDSSVWRCALVAVNGAIGCDLR